MFSPPGECRGRVADAPVFLNARQPPVRCCGLAALGGVVDVSDEVGFAAEQEARLFRRVPVGCSHSRPVDLKNQLPANEAIVE